MLRFERREKFELLRRKNRMTRRVIIGVITYLLILEHGGIADFTFVVLSVLCEIGD
jgi:hypothetical protein